MAGFSRKADRLAGAGVFLLGGLAGLALAWSWAVESWTLLLLAVAGGIWGLWLGSLVGQKGWKWTFWGVSGAISVIFLVGWFG
jgi:hypothetical protein